MFLLGLIAAICYVPGTTGATVPTQWAFLSIALPYWLWKHQQWSPFHSLFGWFALWAVFTLNWTPAPLDLFHELWLVAIWFAAFHLGFANVSLRPLWAGLALGACISVAIAVAQAFGFHGIPTIDDRIAGLYYNPTLFGAVCAMCLIACMSHRLYLFIPPLALGIALSGSRGAALITALFFLFHFAHWALALTAALVTAIGFNLHVAPGSSDAMRLEVWITSFRELSPLFGLRGWGAAAFDAIYFPHFSGAEQLLIHPEFMHNDLLQLFFNYGFAAIAIPIIFLLALCHRGPDRFVLAALATLSTFYFPLWCPLLALGAFASSGNLLAHCELDGLPRNLRRRIVSPWHAHEQPS